MPVISNCMRHRNDIGRGTRPLVLPRTCCLLPSLQNLFHIAAVRSKATSVKTQVYWLEMSPSAIVVATTSPLES